MARRWSPVSCGAWPLLESLQGEVQLQAPLCQGQSTGRMESGEGCLPRSCGFPHFTGLWGPHQ